MAAGREVSVAFRPHSSPFVGACWPRRSFVVPHAVTRDGIAEACAPPAKREPRIPSPEMPGSASASAASRRRAATENRQLTDTGTAAAEARADVLRDTMVLLRGEDELLKSRMKRVSAQCGHRTAACPDACSARRGVDLRRHSLWAHPSEEARRTASHHLDV